MQCLNLLPAIIHPGCTGIGFSYITFFKYASHVFCCLNGNQTECTCKYSSSFFSVANYERQCPMHRVNYVYEISKLSRRCDLLLYTDFCYEVGVKIPEI